MDLKKIKKNKTIQELLDFGLINIDKPTGPSSFWTSQFIKKRLNLKKTSHLGTLDPMVTGVLPVSLGRACKLSDYFMHRNKVYVGIMRLHNEITDSELKKKMKEFLGDITQLPPVKSRVKRANRVRNVEKFEIIEREGKDVLFYSDVQAGTYIRKLIHDLGEKIGGAHMLELRRTKAGMYTEKKMYTLYEFDKAVKEYEKGDEKKLREMIDPAEIVSELLPTIQVKEEAVEKLMNGSPLFEHHLDEKVSGIEEDEKICVFNKETFIGCYKFVGKDELIAKPEFVKN